MVMNRYQRKARFVEAKVSYTDVAREVGCDLATVSRVASGLTVRETDKSLRIKQALARRAGLRVVDLWPQNAA